MSDYLPSELILNILARLPIDDLLRCTSVCKSWYSLITSPSFISSHLNLSISNNESRLLLRFYNDGSKVKVPDEYGGFKIVKTKKEQYYVHRDNQTFDQIAELGCPVTSPNRYFTIVDTFNGLFCLSDDATSYIEKIYLWNPSLRKSVKLPKPRVVFKSHGPYQHAIGFGFLPSTNEYKIVRVVYLQLVDGAKVPPEVEIYELSTSSWRTVNAGDLSYVIAERASQAFLNGIVHWHAHNPNNISGSFASLIVSFDMRSEKFGALMVPKCLQNRWSLSVSTFKESLCLIDSGDNFFLIPSGRNSCCCIWVMKEYGDPNSWEKLFTIDLGGRDIWRPIYFRENGKIFLSNQSGHFLDDVENLFSYDPKSNKVKNLGVCEKARSFYVGTYLESLVLIKGSNEGNKTVKIKGEFQEYGRVVAELERQIGEGSKLEEQ